MLTHCLLSLAAMIGWGWCMTNSPSDLECTNDPCGPDEVGNCRVYQSGQGCTQCEPGSFKFGSNYACVDCQDFFGEECLHCSDGVGCQQCDSSKGFFRQGKNSPIDDKLFYYYCEESPCSKNRRDESHCSSCNNDECSQCMSNYFKLDGSCRSCNDIEGCMHCGDNIGCQQCSDGYTREKINNSSLSGMSYYGCDSENNKKYDFVKDNPFRLQFLGGFNDETDINGDDMCYQYKLHKHLRPRGDKLRNLPSDKDFSNGDLTLSIRFCNDDDDDNSNNGVFGDFLKNVTIIEGNSESDSYYYYDDSHFYYVMKNIDSFDNMILEPVIELCFHMNSSSSSNDVKIVTETEYCLKFNDADELCNDRGIFVTDVCGLDSIARENDLVPAAGISYVPQGGKSYNIEGEARKDKDHGGELMRGRGDFVLHPDLVVLRGWWLDWCELVNDTSDEYDGFFKIVLNDDYIDNITNNNSLINLIDSPITIPIYDHFIVSSECEHIRGSIEDYNHDSDNEELTLYINIKDNSPLMYFGTSKFSLSQMQILSFTDEINGTNSTNSTGRRRMGRLSRRRLKTLSANWEISFGSSMEVIDSSIGYKNVHIASCNADIYADLTIGVGFSLDYDTYSFRVWGVTIDTGIPRGLNKISGSLYASASLGASMSCLFGEVSDDGTISAEILSHRFESKQFSATVGPVVLTVRPFVDLSMEITRPALYVTLSADASVGGSISFEAGWEKSSGSYAVFDKGFNWDLPDSLDVDHPGSDGRLEAGFAFVITPGLAFGLYYVDLIEFGVPLGVPEITAVLDFSDITCSSSSQIGLDFYLEFALTVNAMFGISEIEILGIVLFDGISWSPDDPLLSIDLGTLDVWNGGECIDSSAISSSTLFGGGYQETKYLNYKYVFVHTLFDGNNLHWEQANAYCSIEYNTSLATISTATQASQIGYFIDEMFTKHYSSDTFPYPWIGLNDRDIDGTYVWVETGDVATTLYWGVGEPNGGTIENCVVATYVGDWWDYSCDDTSGNVKSFICNLDDEILEKEKYIGVFAYDVDSDSWTWEEANDYCFERFGTELASFHSDEDVALAYSILEDLAASNSNFDVNIAWFGLRNISNSTHFDWIDKTENDYTRWRAGEPNSISIEQCGTLYLSEGDEWINIDCNTPHRAFICNVHNLYVLYETDNYMGMEATKFGVTWEESNKVCETEYDTALASIHSSTYQAEAYHIHNTMNGEYLWIGFNDIEVEGTWEWIAGDESTSYRNWRVDEPEGGTAENCAQLYIYGEWIDLDCNDERYRGFICNKPHTVVEYGRYVGIYSHSIDDAFLYDFDEANEYCQTYYGTELATITSSNDMDEAYFIFENITASSAWIGFSDSDSEGTWTWIDGDTSSSYTNWYTTGGEPGGGTSENCAMIYSDYDGYWIDIDCSTKANAFLCNLNNTYTFYESSNYMGAVARYGITWSEANDVCEEEQGTSLGSINSETLNNEVINDIISIINDNLWIGLNDINSETTYSWIERDEIATYLNWYPGEPSDTVDENCVLMFTNGQWIDISCESYFNSFLCKRPNNYTIYESDHYIGMIPERWSVTWSEANDACEKEYGTSLASISSSTLNSEIYTLSNNIGDQVWIGFNDIDIEDTWQWIDEYESTTISFTDWLTGEPNGGTSENCGIIYHHSDWADVDCDRTDINGFICKKPNDYNIYSSDYYIGMVPTVYGVTWTEANDVCNSKYGTSLATISSSTYDTDAGDLTTNIGDRVWIGLNDIDIEDTWQWIDGSGTTTYTSWVTGEPNGGTSENCAMIFNHDEWADVDCQRTDIDGFLCNVDTA